VNVYRVVNGRAEAHEIGAQTLAEASVALPEGVYTTLRVYPGGYVVRLDDHLARLELSGQLLGRPLGLDRSEVRRALGEAFRHSGLAEARARLTASVPPGVGPADVVISLEAFTSPSAAVYAHGVRVQTIAGLRAQPRAKTTDFIAPSRNLYRQMPTDIYELIMVDDDGHLLEGLTSNFFALRDGVLYTAAEGVLEGVTRTLVIELAARTLPVRLEAIRKGHIASLTEAFITSSSREIVPVVALDGAPIGDGAPGPVARRLLDAYRSQIRKEWQALL
jgi:branched-chain amino acid aminotransferase